MFAKIYLVLAVLQLASANSLIAGGWSDEKPIEESEELPDYVASVRSQFLTKSGWQSVPKFDPISFKSQVVAGINFIVKVQLDEDRYAHLLIYVPHSKRRPQLMGFQLSKSLNDDLQYFQPSFPADSGNQLGVIDDQAFRASVSTQVIVNKIKPQFVRWAGAEPADFHAISYKKQTVAGVNLFVKVRIDGDEYAHLRIFSPLPGEGDDQLVGVEVDKSLADSIEYFSPNIPVTNNSSMLRLLVKYQAFVFVVIYLFFAVFF